MTQQTIHAFFIAALIFLTSVLLGCGADKPVVEEPPVVVESEEKIGPQSAALLKTVPEAGGETSDLRPVTLHFDVAPLEVTVNGGTACIDKAKAIAHWYLPSDVSSGDFTCKIEWIHPNGLRGDRRL